MISVLHEHRKKLNRFHLCAFVALLRSAPSRGARTFLAQDDGKAFHERRTMGNDACSKLSLIQRWSARSVGKAPQNLACETDCPECTDATQVPALNAERMPE